MKKIIVSVLAALCAVSFASCGSKTYKDGTYTVHVSICEMESDTPMLDLKITVDTRKSAKYVYNHWDEKAAKIYELLYDNLFD